MGGEALNHYQFKVDQAVMRIATAIQDLTCMVGSGGDPFITERLRMIHDSMSQVKDTPLNDDRLF